jgi:ribosome-binding factor A
MAGPDGSRRRKVAELIRRELAPALQAIGRDAGAGMLSLTAVDVSPDLRQARIAVTHLGGVLSGPEVLERLRLEAGALRNQLAHSLSLRTVPRLSFELDDSLVKGARLSALLKGTDVGDGEFPAVKP